MPRNGFFVNLSVQVKIVIASAVGVVMAGVVGTLALFALSKSAGAAKHIYSENVQHVAEAGAIEAALGVVRVDLANQLISSDAATRWAPCAARSPRSTAPRRRRPARRTG